MKQVFTASGRFGAHSCLAACFLFIILGLSDSYAGEEASPGGYPTEKRRTVLLLPFKDLAAVYGTYGNIRSPINGRVFLSGPVEKGAGRFMDARLHTILNEKESFILIAAEEAGDMLTTLANRHLQSSSERNLWVDVGRMEGVDAVLGGFIYRFRDRTGRDYGVEEAASVAFDLHLIRVADGRIQWSGRFDETQQPLSNNLYNIKKFINRGGKWVTSREMASGGLKSLIDEMPAK